MGGILDGLGDPAPIAADLPPMPDVNPDGILGVADLGPAGADMDAWANGTHPLSPPDVAAAAQAAAPAYGAEGIGEALEGTKMAAEGAHGFGYAVGSLAGGESPVLEGLEHVNSGFVYPLTIAQGIADGFSDVHNGASVADAASGNFTRTALTAGAIGLGDAVLPIVGGAVAGYLANKYLPDGAVLGHTINQSFSDPQQANAMLSLP